MPAFEYINPSSLGERLQGLAQRLSRGIHLDLELSRRLSARLGNPHRAYPTIHVAGTNGKGSVCAFLASVYRAAGYRVGLYTSPHLIRFNERIQVNGQPVSDDELVAVMKQLDAACGEDEVQTLGRLATFFEYVTVLAFEVFKRNKVDVAIIETGLGGRLDATNIVEPMVSVISSISMDHADYLGATLVDIAREKAGIIKPERPVVTANQDPQVMAVLLSRSLDCHAPFSEAAKDVSCERVASSLDGMDVQLKTPSFDYGIVRLPVLGFHQIENAALALRAVELVNVAGPIRATADEIRSGLERMKWPGRLHILQRDPLMVLDCAHNADGGLRLAETLTRLSAGRPVGLIVGMCRDKDTKSFLNAFQNIVKTCWPVTLRTERSLASDELASMIGSQSWAIRRQPLQAALLDARDWARREGGIVCIAGSVYLAGEVLEIVEKESWNEQA